MAKQHVRVELYRGGAWTVERDPDDATCSAAYARDAIQLIHGRGPEQGEPTPSSASLTFKGHTHNPENPASELYGEIGVNTPIRISTGDQPALEDDFNRTVSDSWSGGSFTWTLAGSSTFYDVDGAQGTMTLTVDNAVFHASADTGSPDHRVRATFSFDQDNITGTGAAVVELRVRYTDPNNTYRLLVDYAATTELVTARIRKTVAGSSAAVGGTVTVASLSGAATTSLTAEFYIEGARLYASVWETAQPEPISWQISVQDDDLTTGNGVELAAWRVSGNTNSNLVARFASFAAIPGTIRFCGEVADWRPRRSAGGDRWVELEAGDPLRRLQEPQADALRSALWREVLFGGPVAFWPINDGENASTAASALPGGAPATLVSRNLTTLEVVPIDWEPVAVNSWVEPIGTPAPDTQLTFSGAIDMDPAATEWAMDFAFSQTDDIGSGHGVLIAAQDGGDGSASNPRVGWIVAFLGDGNWYVIHRLSADGHTDTPIGSGAVAVRDGRLHYARFTTVRDGSDVDWELWVDGISLGSGTVTRAWNPLSRFEGSTGTEIGQTSAGFISFWDTSSPPFNVFNAAAVGRSGELVGDRLARLLEEEDIALELLGTAANTEAAGPQLIDTLAANLAALEAVDMGLLYGTRHQVGLTYRTREHLYGQSPVTLDVEAGGEVAEPLEPVIGALGVVNDVTVKRPNGSSARSVAETGPLNVNPPHLDAQGVGRYQVEVTVHADLDHQLQGLADWRRHRGTQKAVRYPKVTVKFGALAADGKTTLAAAVDRLRIGDRVDLANAEPTGVAQLVPGYSETIGPTVAEREITLNGVPAKVYEVGVYDAATSKYDSGYSSVATGITTGTDTALSVAVEAGRTLWVTGSGAPQFPLDIDLLGARVRVTAISGTSSPQTFTIDATVVNGIAKVIPAGTPVRLWAPRRYGL